MSFMRFNFLLLLVLVIFISTAAVSSDRGGAMMCGRKIIHAGDSKYLLLSRFGQPENKEFIGTVQRGTSCVKIEEWLYICYDHAKPKMYVIRIIETTIDSITWLPDVQQ